MIMYKMMIDCKSSEVKFKVFFLDFFREFN